MNSDILTPPSLTLNTFGTMQPVIKSILFKKCSQQFLYGFPYEATISIHARVQEFSSRRMDSRCICHKNLIFWSSTYFIEVNWFISKKILIFHGSRGGPSILPVVRMDSNFFQGGGGGVSRCLIIPYLSPYNLCSGLPSGSKHAILGLSGCCDKS